MTELVGDRATEQGAPVDARAFSYPVDAVDVNRCEHAGACACVDERVTERELATLVVDRARSDNSYRQLTWGERQLAGSVASSVKRMCPWLCGWLVAVPPDQLDRRSGHDRRRNLE